jgi:hypothetical protein
VFRIERSHAEATDAAGVPYNDGAFAGRAYNKIGTGGWVINNMSGVFPPPLPSWLTEANGTKLDVFGSVGGTWAVRLRIPIVADADVSLDNAPGVHISGSSFRFWFEFQSTNHEVVQSFPPLTTKAETDDAATTTCIALPFICFPDVSTWAPMTLDTTCGADVALAPTDVYVNAPGNRVVDLSGPNVLHVRPLNNTGALQPGNWLKATLRLSGTSTDSGLPPTWETLCEDAVASVTPVPPGERFDIACTWNVSESDFIGRFQQRDELTGTSWAFDLKIVAVVVMKFLQRLDDQKIYREPNWPAPVGISAEQFTLRLARLVTQP